MEWSILGGRGKEWTFDYAVDFFGPPDHLHGKAIVDGVAYEWKGRMNDRQFRANFGGDRYSGSFDLKRDETPRAATRGPNRQEYATDMRQLIRCDARPTGSIPVPLPPR